MPAFLFLLVVKSLSRLIKIYKRYDSTKGIRMGESIPLTHLLFVDDILLFIMGTKGEEKKFKEMMDLYRKTTRMEVNIDKSSILFNDLKEDREMDCRLITPFNLVPFDDGV